MSRAWLDRLDLWKSRFGQTGDGQLERLLSQLARRAVRDPQSLIRLHETLLFLRAYPRSAEVARLADEILFSFADRIADDVDPFEAPEVSGIAGTSLTAVFSYEVARRLAARYPRAVEIAWDRYDEPDRMGNVIRRFLPMLDEDFPVEAHVPFQQWIAQAHDRRSSDLAWLLERLAAFESGDRARAELFESMQVPLTWRMGVSRASRSRLRLAVRSLYLHREPLLRRSDVSLAHELNTAPLPIRRLARPAAGRILDLILDTSAMRYRELYGFSHPEETAVFHAVAGRGVDIYFFGVPPEWRLPLRAYHGGMFFKNGVPAGYVELLSLFERAEVGFNLYYTFREGESAWIYARLLRLFRQVLGVTCFSVDPYQIGHENPEAVESGAFWFYRKLGFRATNAGVARLVEREEARMRQTPGYRSSHRTLERLAEGYILYEMPGTESGDWDHFSIRTLAQRLQRGVLPPAKPRGAESRYLRLMQKDARLRAKWLKLGRQIAEDDVLSPEESVLVKKAERGMHAGEYVTLAQLHHALDRTP
jgi:hypothetical protein